MNNELDDMKQVWQNNPTTPSALDESEVISLLAARSKNALTHLRNNLLFEAVLGVGVIGVLFYMASVAPNDQARFAMIQLGLLISPLFVFYYYGLQSLKKGIDLSGNLREYLKESVAYWERALQLYFWGGLMLLPIVIITAGWYRMSILGETNILIFGGSTLIVIGKIVASSLILAVSVWVLIRVTYRVYVDRLKKCLKELEGES